jgi:protein tyrosine/serine phosphatase
VIKSFIKPETRYKRRMKRIARWDRPLHSRWQRFYAYVHMLLADHGLFRAVYLNFHQVTPLLWRSAQPHPLQIAAMARRGLRTIVNLRGGREHGSWPLEKEACQRHDIVLTELIVRSREAPSRDMLLSAKAFFDSLHYPALIHCKSGADRAGFVAVLFLILQEKASVAEAMQHLNLRYGHFSFAKTGILDAFFELYRVEGESKGIHFMDWVRDIYDPERLTREFKPGFFSDFIVDRVIDRE